MKDKDKKSVFPKSSRGFTIVELVVVIFILSFGMLGVVSLITQTVQVSHINKNMVIASQLCQESLELVRNARDNNWLGKDNWETGSTTNSNTDWIQDGVYSIDYTGVVKNSFNIDDPLAKLYLDSSDLYRHFLVPGSATTTPFSRTIEIRSQSGASTTVECVVQWSVGNNKNRFTAQEVLYNWRQVP